MVLLSSTAVCAAGLTNSLKIGLAHYSKPRLGKLRQTGTVAVWLKTLKPMMLLFTGNQWFNECKPHPPTRPESHRSHGGPRLGGRMYVDDRSNRRENSTGVVASALLPRLPCHQQHIKSSQQTPQF